MALVLNYPINTADAMDRGRADDQAGESIKKKLKTHEEADRERRCSVMSQEQSDGFNAWSDGRFAQAFASAVAEGSAFDSAWVECIREGLVHDRQSMRDYITKAAADAETRFEARLAASEQRAERADERARAAETALIVLRGLVRNDVIRLSDDLLERTREATTAPATELRADVRERFAALRSELGEKIASLSARPSIDAGQVYRAVEAAVGRTRVEMRAEFDRILEARLKERERAFEEHIVEFQRRTLAAEERARTLETVGVELRQQVCNDVIRLAHDLHARVRDASVAATVELRSEFETKLATALPETDKRAERAEERARAIENAVAELRDKVREDIAAARGDLRQAGVMKTVIAAELRDETAAIVEAKIAARVTSTDDVRRIVDVAISTERQKQQDRFTALIAESGHRVGATINDKIDAKIARIERLIEKQHNLSTNDVPQIVTDAVNEVAKIERAERNRAIDAVSEEVRRAAKADDAELEKRLTDVTGELSRIRDWSPETVAYKGQLFTCDGALYQARKNTVAAPGAPDWTLSIEERS